MSMLTSHWNATRFAQKPLSQPVYNFAHVPGALPNLQYSSLQYVDNREAFHSCMAEMLLLCKEAQRRRRRRCSVDGSKPVSSATTASKPLSLEYLADRIDVDDPIFGFVVRTEEKSPEYDDNDDTGNTHWRRGMLQGFITCTTFTNYQKTFQWDSLNPAAFFFDPEEDINDSVVRVKDVDGSLAAEMQATVRCGDIWNEGIVWPRIAEISLLGGLKCGKALVSMVIEHLECMKASGRCNYDFVALQATDNSISFYESMGFVRVGAVVREEQESDTSSNKSVGTSNNDSVAAEAVPDDSPEKPNAVARAGVDFVCSPTISYTIAKAGETLQDVARKVKVDVWDIVFLNKDVYADINPRSRLLAGTVLQVPAPKPKTVAKVSTKTLEPPRWYIAKEDDTPRYIAKKFNLNCLELVEANKHRLEGLLSSSRLKAGTRVQVSRFDFVPDRGFKPYAHWSFPDDQFEEPEPSYMMARRLERRKGSTCTSKQRPFEASLAIPITTYEPTDLVVPPSPESTPVLAEASAPNTALPSASCATIAQATQAQKPPEPQRPKRAPPPFLIFASEQRRLRRDEIQGMRGGDVSKYLSSLWNAMSEDEKAKYVKQSIAMTQEYRRLKVQYTTTLDAHNSNTSATATSADSASTSTHESSDVSSSTTDLVASTVPRRVGGSLSSSSSSCSLFNMVVKLKPGAMTEGSEYTYWYVLTFIPDLRWCHLAPMIPVGTFGPDKPKSQGRPKYKLVDESLGKEVDISSSFCIPIKSRSTKRTLDADKEEWDIIDDGTSPCNDVVKSVSKPSQNFSRGGFGETPGSHTLGTEVSAPLTASDHLPRLSAIFRDREVVVNITYSTVKRNDSQTNNPKNTLLGKRKRPLSKDRTSFSSASTSCESTEDEEASRKKQRGRVGDQPLKRGRGRPKGSKNKPKIIESNVAQVTDGSSAILVERSSAPLDSASTIESQVQCGPRQSPKNESLDYPSLSVSSSSIAANNGFTPKEVTEGLANSPVPSQTVNCEDGPTESDTTRSGESPSENQSKPRSFIAAAQEFIKPFAIGLSPPRRGRGRPKGAKNKPKNPAELSSLPPPLPVNSIQNLEQLSKDQKTDSNAHAPSSTVLQSEPELHASPATPTNASPVSRPSSTPSSMRSRAEPPTCSRSAPRRAALFGQFLHSPLVRVRGARVSGTDAVRLSSTEPSRCTGTSAPAPTSVPDTVHLSRDDSLAASSTWSKPSQARLSRKSSVASESSKDSGMSSTSVRQATRSKSRSAASKIEQDTSNVNASSPSRRGRSRARKSRQEDDESTSVASQISSTSTPSTRSRCSPLQPGGPATRSQAKSGSLNARSAKERLVDFGAEEGSRSAGCGRRHVNSPLVRRSIRNRRGRHVSQRNELQEPSATCLRPAAESRKRTRSSPDITESRERMSSPKVDEGKGKLSRELMSLLLGDRPRKRRKVKSAGSCRSVLQN